MFERLGEQHARAVTAGQIANILKARGMLDEALRIHKEERLPVFRRRGDEREHAVTMGQIAEILETRGETDEALRIYQEEVIPVLERLGDERDRATAWETSRTFCRRAAKPTKPCVSGARNSFPCSRASAMYARAR